MSWSSTERSLGSSLGLPAQTLLEPEGIPLKLYNMAAVGQAVEEGSGEPGVTEDFHPWRSPVGGPSHVRTSR